ncbi:hypothetical protein BC835DRAFT_1306854 [Cytidiella melzeri]|nr:hypothetical protein BC835DRAFT_1306854 [Cytidiella melzeri]
MVPTRLLTEHTADAQAIGTRPRPTRSLSQGSRGFSVQAIGMHYDPAQGFNNSGKAASVGLNLPPALINTDRKTSPTSYDGQSSLRRLLPLDTKMALQAGHTEIAMEVAEKVAMLCHTDEPISTDAPLSGAVVSLRNATKVKSWLQERFDFDKSATELMTDAITPETLAAEILAIATTALPERPWCTGSIPIIFDGLDFEVSQEDMEFGSLDTTPPRESKQVAPHIGAVPVPVFSPPILVSPSTEVGPPSATRDKKTGRSPPASDGRFSKKAGFAVGLLAVGALLGSPNCPSFDQFDLSLPETPSPFTIYFAPSELYYGHHSRPYG